MTSEGTKSAEPNQAPQHADEAPSATRGGPMARLGAAMAVNATWVFGVWVIVLIALGAAAPTVFNSLAGAGWQANGSESVRVRELAEEHFGGGPRPRAGDIHSVSHEMVTLRLPPGGEYA